MYIDYLDFCLSEHIFKYLRDETVTLEEAQESIFGSYVSDITTEIDYRDAYDKLLSERKEYEDLIIDIGSMLKRERLYQNLSQKTVSERSGISESALKNLEGGCGASLRTFIQVCRTLGKDEWILRLGPADAVSIEDYVKRGGRPRVRAAASRKVVR